ncbi:MAG: hypothetical protein PUP92_05780 [Rhizonema sp. PD38]|nr:hypothetical protein [Rhizonema sp. PD38]
MKLKLLNFLTVCLVTLAVLSPGLFVFSIVWEQHMSLVQTQSLACEVARSSAGEYSSAFNQTDLLAEDNISREKVYPAEKILNFLKYNKIFRRLRSLLLLLPILIGIFIVSYDKYLVYRATVLKKQVEMLERLWHHSIEQ